MQLPIIRLAYGREAFQLREPVLDNGEVVGSGVVTIVDASELTHSSRAQAGSGDALSLLDIRMHVLAEGCKYNMQTRKATMP